MKRLVFRILAAVSVMMATFGLADISAKTAITKMTLTTTIDKVTIKMVGSSTVAIDWGDDSEVETKVLQTYSNMWAWPTTAFSSEYFYTHSYSGYASRIITISGENITHMACFGNQLTILDISENTELTELICYENQLTRLDLSNNTKLTRLVCGENQLTNLDVSKNSVLTGLYCLDNKLTILDVSKNTELWYLNCKNNKLTSLVVSKNNTEMRTLECDQNKLRIAALNILFETLPDNAEIKAKGLSITGNPGTNSCDLSIAKNNGWKINYR